MYTTRKKYQLADAEHRELLGVVIRYNYLLSIYLRDFFKPGEGENKKDNDYRKAMTAYFYAVLCFPFTSHDRQITHTDTAFIRQANKSRIAYTQWKEIDTFFREDYEGDDSQDELEIYRDYRAKFDRIFALHDSEETGTTISWLIPYLSSAVSTENNPLYHFIISCTPAKRKKLSFLDLLNYAYLTRFNLVAQNGREKIINSAVLLTTSSTAKTYSTEDITDIVSILSRTALILTMEAPALTTTRNNRKIATLPQKQYARELVHNVHEIVTSSHSDEEFSLLAQCAGLCTPLNSGFTLHNSIYYYTQYHNFHPPHNSYQLCADFVEFCRARNEDIVST